MRSGLSFAKTENLLSAPFFFSQDILESKAVSDAALITFAVLYSLVILGSVVGNVLVITAVLKAPKMRKVRRSMHVTHTCKQKMGMGGNLCEK